MARDAGPHRIRRAVERQLDQPRVVERAQHRRAQRAERQRIALVQRGRRRAVLGARAVVAGAEHDGREAAHVVHRERAAARQTHLDRPTGVQMDPGTYIDLGTYDEIAEMDKKYRGEE